VGSQAATSKKAVEIAEAYEEGMYAAVGLHPLHAKDEIFDKEYFLGLGQKAKVVAVGECGLDYYRVVNPEIKSLQAEVFRAHIELARELNKPLMIHCRNAHQDILKILNSRFSVSDSGLRGDIHFFSGTWQEAKKYLELGFYLSFTGVITFANQYDEIIKKMPLERLMVETDAPYVAPAPHRHKRNEPLFVREVAKRIAEIRDLSYEEVAQITTQNAQKLFGL
jgi:TatD DNase family protein